MHALILQGNGKYYVSAVFGFYVQPAPNKSPRDHRSYWIVWNEEKTRLIRWLNRVPNTIYIIPQILIVNSEQADWNVDDHGIGCVDFLSKELLDSILDAERQPEEILNKCHAVDESYTYAEIQEIKNQKDIENLEWVSYGFHDAHIAKEELRDDGTLYVLF